MSLLTFPSSPRFGYELDTCAKSTQVTRDMRTLSAN